MPEHVDATLTTFCGLTIFGIPWVAVLMTKKLEHMPDSTAAEAVEWSKPSLELERAIAEQEVRLQATNGAPKSDVA